MLYVYNGKRLNIPDSEIKSSMAKLGLTKDEAIQMYLEDNEIIINEEQEALTQKAVKSGVQKQMAKVTSNRKSEKKRERKPDEVKEDIIHKLAEFIPSFGENVQIENVGKIITFNIGDEHFTLNLVRNRQKKSKGG
jgi:DNA recombination-dependent growth factor C